MPQLFYLNREVDLYLNWGGVTRSFDGVNSITDATKTAKRKAWARVLNSQVTVEDAHTQSVLLRTFDEATYTSILTAPSFVAFDDGDGYKYWRILSMDVSEDVGALGFDNDLYVIANTQLTPIGKAGLNLDNLDFYTVKP